MIIHCGECNYEFTPVVGQTLLGRERPDVGEGVDEYYLKCPECGDETHTHFTNEVIRRRQTHVQLCVELHKKRRTEKTWDEVNKAKAKLNEEWYKLNPPPDEKVEAA